jgi:hypothetical protein
MYKSMTSSMFGLLVLLSTTISSGALAATQTAPAMPPGFEPIPPINVELPKPIEPSKTPLPSVMPERSNPAADTNSAVMQNQQQNDQKIREREAQVDAKLREIEEKLKQLETRTIGPQATPLQIQANQALIGQLQFNAQGLLDKFQANNQLVEKINKEANLTPQLLQAYNAIPAEQEAIVKQLLELEGKIRAFDPSVIFPQLQAQSLNQISQLPGYKKLSIKMTKELRTELDNIKAGYTSLSNNQYTLQNPTEEEKSQFKKHWKVQMSETKLPIATVKFHEEFTASYKQVSNKLQALTANLAAANSIGIDVQSLEAELIELQQVDIFSKTSPEQLSQSIGLSYTGKQQIDIDTSMQEFYWKIAKVCAGIGCLTFIIFAFKLYLHKKEEKSEETND